LRCLFLRKPCGIVLPTNSCCVRYIVKCQWIRAGLHDRFSGTHILRHTVATILVREGFPLKLIADVLNHHSIDSTSIYAQVDVPSLRKAARPWPGKGVS
jgi:site-specific recombinase XerD